MGCYTRAKVATCVTAYLIAKYGLQGQQILRIEFKGQF